jgi:hypothetical protein
MGDMAGSFLMWKAYLVWCRYLPPPVAGDSFRRLYVAVSVVPNNWSGFAHVIFVSAYIIWYPVLFVIFFYFLIFFLLVLVIIPPPFLPFWHLFYSTLNPVSNQYRSRFALVARINTLLSLNNLPVCCTPFARIKIDIHRGYIFSPFSMLLHTPFYHFVRILNSCTPYNIRRSVAWIFTSYHMKKYTKDKIEQFLWHPSVIICYKILISLYSIY